jgi:hypothetical protein
MLKALLRVVLIALVLAPIWYVFARLLYTRTGARDAVEHAVRASSRVDSLTGGVEAVRVRLLGSQLQVSGPEGSASITVAIDGTVRDAEARLRMERRLGQWRVMEMSSDSIVP